MQSAAGDNEAEGFKGWLFLDYWLFRYLCQGSLLMSLAVLTCSGVSRKTVRLWLSFTYAENQILKFSLLKPLKISSIWKLKVIRNSGMLKTGYSQDTRKVWGLKLLSKKYWSRLAEIHSGNRRSCPKRWTYRLIRVMPHQGQSIHDSAPPLKGTPPYSCFEGDPMDKNRACPPVACWKQAQKQPLHEWEIFLHWGAV